MVIATTGVLMSCDEPLKQYLLSLNDARPTRCADRCR